ncbi:MAG: hypothetical protein KF764_17665 [Labilithrix sp.]|nr:hypothetical protein [Labilithrix sp.]
MHHGPPRHHGPPQHPYGSPQHPYGAPQHPYGPAPHGHLPEQDEAAGFAPTLLVNVACIALVVVAVLMFVLMARLLLATRGTTGGLVAIGHGVLGLLALAGAIGVRSGRLALAIVGIVSCPLAAVASAFALLTGSIAGLAGGALSFVTLVVSVIALRDVARMGAAREALRAGVVTSAELGPPSGPLSGDLPRVKPRRWPVLVALLGIVVVGAGGAAAWLRFAAGAEREKELAAFRSLEECLLGGSPAAGVPPSVAYRRMELTLVVAPPSQNPWPARCATHAHALHESKRRSGAAADDVKDAAFFAERLGRVLTDPRGASVYKAVDELWAEATKEGYVAGGGEAGAAAPAWLDVDALAGVAPFSKTRLALASLRTDRVSGPTFRLLVDGARQRGEGRLCTLDGLTFRCAPLPSPLDETSLSLLGGAEPGAAPLLFAGGGQAGIFRPTGELLAEMPTYGAVARADGSIGIAGYDRRASKFVLVRAERGAAPARTPFPLEGVTDDRQVALLDDNLVWATSAGALSVARLLPSGAPLGPSVELGAVGTLGALESLEGCRTRDAFFVLAYGAMGSAVAIDSGDRWSALVPAGDGAFGCSGKEAFLLDQRVRAGGTGAISLERCTAAGCQRQGIDLDEVFEHNVELLPKIAPLALPLDGKLLLVWRAGQRGGLRMRLAPIEQIASTEDVVLFDDRIQGGQVAERSTLLEIRGWSREGRAVILVATTSGVWALGIAGDGKVTPIETTR